jgi:hypothetical protein
MEKIATYHFTVPNTNISYVIKLGYQNGFIRNLEIKNLVYNSRPVTELDIPVKELELYREHVSNKIRNISLIAR